MIRVSKLTVVEGGSLSGNRDHQKCSGAGRVPLSLVGLCSMRGISCMKNAIIFQH